MFLAKDNLNSIDTESYRMLKTNIEYSSELIKNNSKVITITSVKQGEGKSTVAINTAFVMADAGKKVILIDFNLRKPSLHNILKIENNSGISNVVDESLNLSEVIKTIDGVDIVTAGTMIDNPSKLLSSACIKNIISNLRSRYDFVIFDSAAALAVADTQILSTYSDGVVLVIKSGSSKADELNQVKECFDRVGSRIVGTVLNKVDRKQYVKSIKINNVL